MENKTRVKMAYSMAAVFIAAGLLLNYFGIGGPVFTTFGSVGSWLLYIGFMSIIIATVRLLFIKKERKVDERMLFVAAKANRITFLALVVGAFIIIVADGISPIAIPYHLFMSYMVCALMLVYVASYKVLLRMY